MDIWGWLENELKLVVGTIKGLLEAGAIGPVRYVRGFLSTQAQDPTGWRAQQAEARYWALSGVGTHLIDLWRWYFGEPTSGGGCSARCITA